jgi:hypothetical protein
MVSLETASRSRVTEWLSLVVGLSVKRISPDTRAWGGSRRMMANEEIDLPEPDSPTRPRTSPGAMEKLRSRTAGSVCVGTAVLA